MALKARKTGGVRHGLKTPFSRALAYKGVSLRGLAEATGIPWSTLGNYSRGVRTPDRAQAVRIARALRVPVAELFGGDDR